MSFSWSDAEDSLLSFQSDLSARSLQVVAPLQALLGDLSSSAGTDAKKKQEEPSWLKEKEAMKQRPDSGFSSKLLGEGTSSNKLSASLRKVASSPLLTSSLKGESASKESGRKDECKGLDGSSGSSGSVRLLTKNTKAVPKWARYYQEAPENETMETTELNTSDVISMAGSVEMIPLARYRKLQKEKGRSECHEKELSKQLERTEHQLEDVFGKHQRLARQLRTKEREHTSQTDSGDFWKRRALNAEKLLLMTTLLYSCQITDFMIFTHVATGCDGAVFLAKCMKRGSESFDRQVFALKVLFNIFRQSTFTKVRSYYRSEYEILSCLPRHENIVRLYAHFYDRIDPQKFPELPPEVKEEARTLSLFLVMEDHGDTLEKFARNLRSLRQLTVRKVMDLALQLLLGVQHLLDNYVIHRDLKLNNVLISDEGVLKICDFGSAIQLDPKLQLLFSPGGSLGGNPAHMPPEILNASPNTLVDCSSQDVWAVGYMIYEICGQDPFGNCDQRGYRMTGIPDLQIVYEKKPNAYENFSKEFISLGRSLLHYDCEKRPSVDKAIGTLKGILN